MSVQQKIIVDNERASSISEELISPVTTDSMVTVPLSDRQSISENDSTQLDLPTTPVAEETLKSDYFVETVEETDLTPKNDRTEEASTNENKTRSITPIERASSTQDGYESASSAESDAGVDWEKLDKTEKQESRTGATDEVSTVRRC